MDFKDYYEILGVSPDADEKTIKQAYRKLARRHHPDVNPGNKESEEKFKTINEAYQALSNPEQRKKYDELRIQYQRWQQSGRNPRDFNWQSWAAQTGQEVNVQYGTPEDFEDLFGGESPFSDFFPRSLVKPVAAALLPDLAKVRMLRPLSNSRWRKPIMGEPVHFKLVIDASKRVFHPVSALARG